MNVTAAAQKVCRPGLPGFLSNDSNAAPSIKTNDTFQEPFVNTF